MAGSVNKAIIVGNVGRDPEIRSTQDGTRIANLSVATSESWRDKTSGERKEKTEWHRVSIWNDRLVEVCEKYVVKGTKLYLEGALQTRKYTDRDGNEKFATEIVLQKFRGELTILDGGRDGRERHEAEGDYDENRGTGRQTRGGQRSGGSKPTAPESRPHNDLDDDIPF